MNRTLHTLILAAAMVLPVTGQPAPSLADHARLRMTRSALVNFNAALDMWHQDHRDYPRSLDQLVPNYLRHIPPGPNGQASDWEYRLEGEGYEIKLKGEPFLAFGAREISTRNLPSVELRPELTYTLPLPSDKAQGWSQNSGGYENDGQYLSASLAGPFAFGQTGSDWVAYAVEEYRNLPGAAFEIERAFEQGELRGVEVVASWAGRRSRTYYVTDGEAGWIFSYTAEEEKYSSEVDAMFQDMVSKRRRG